MALHRFSAGIMIFMYMVLPVCSLKAEIPFAEAKGLYLQTKDEFKEISPFWAMVAIHGKFLERIRFFGFYGQEMRDNKPIDVPLSDDDCIAVLLLKLFPSPDGIQFTPNNRMNDPVGNLSRNLQLMDKIIMTLLSPATDKVKIGEIAQIIPRRQGNKEQDDIKSNSKFAEILVNAYNQGKTDHRYPKNIVILSLLGFTVKIADHVKDLNRYVPTLLEGDALGNEVFSVKEYDAVKMATTEDKFIGIISSMEGRSNPELAFLMAKGFDSYEKFITEPVTYRADTCFGSLDNLFPDCGETSLRNALVMLLSAGNQGKVLQEALEEFNKKIELDKAIDPVRYKNFQSFIKDYSHTDKGAIKKTHDDWAKVVSSLHQKISADLSHNDVQYGRKVDEKKKNAPHSYEIKSNFAGAKVQGLINMLNVIAHIVPDQTLNEKWDENNKYAQASKKLDRLCELFSRADLELHWKTQETGDQNVDKPFTTIIFMSAGKELFKWHFQDGHFQVDPIHTIHDDWRLYFASNTNFINEWMASLYRRPSTNTQNHYPDGLLPLSLVYNPTLATMEGVINTAKLIIAQDDKVIKTFEPLIYRWINRTVPLNDAHALVTVCDFLESHKEKLAKIISQVLSKAKAGKMLEGNIIALALNQNKRNAALLLIEDDANLEGKDENGRTALHIAISHQDGEIIKNLFVKGASIDATDNQGWTPLYWAATRGNIEIVEELLAREKRLIEEMPEAKTRARVMSVNVKALNGQTVLHAIDNKIQQLEEEENVNKMMKKSAQTGKETLLTEGQTEIGKLQAIKELLIKEGANKDEKDEWGD